MVQPVTSNMPDISSLMATASVVPEMTIIGTILILLVGGVYAGNRITNMLLGLGLFVLVSLIGIMSFMSLMPMHQTLFSNLFITDAFSHFVKILLVTATALSFMLSAGWLAKTENQQFEYTILMLFTLLGMMLMASANDLTSSYLSLELSSLPSYVLASFKRDSLKSTESGIKYFVLGALASGMLLFGMSLVYGFSGTTSFEGLAHLFSTAGGATEGVVIGMVLMIVGFCFKISAAPFHMWTPDVYEGAPTPITAFFSIGPKVAAIALFTRILIQPFNALLHDWQQIIVVISIASMIVGALGALTQTNIKRLLAYGSIGHVGYALVGLATGSVAGVMGLLIYFSLYIFMSAGAFAVVLMMERSGTPVETLNDLAGLSKSRPRMALAFAILMLSMAGIPPFAGFFSKLYVFLAAINSGLTTLAVIGVLASVVACYYYLKIIKIMYFDEAAQPLDSPAPASTRWVLVIGTLVTLIFFLSPSFLVNQARMAAEALFL